MNIINTVKAVPMVAVFIASTAVKSVPVMINDANQAICNKIMK